MHVVVTLSSGEIRTFDNVKYISNNSTFIENDWLHICLENDVVGYPMCLVASVAVGYVPDYLI